jgi:hypothetical protein
VGFGAKPSAVYEMAFICNKSTTAIFKRTRFGIGYVVLCKARFAAKTL